MCRNRVGLWQRLAGKPVAEMLNVILCGGAKCTAGPESTSGCRGRLQELYDALPRGRMVTGMKLFHLQRVIDSRRG